MPAVVVDSTCLIALERIEQLRIASEMGLRPIGTVGVILRAKRAGLVPTCRPLLESLLRSGFHLSDSLLGEALRLAGED